MTLLLCLTACSGSTTTVTATPAPQIPVTVSDPVCHDAAEALLTALQESVKLNAALFHGNKASAIVRERILHITANRAITKAKACLS